ncbi:type II secretion system F family protein [Actinoallomurus sp. NBC_01490]|uniref:type II secretion system F family protein n=1 Tax=Actinoallomurus sp. NBC_01490 TaxID=2903557 RepID=UPI002E309BFA|nr:type II secretion system F family protein [Actinoallomurus sp. NBC_01490]
MIVLAAAACVFVSVWVLSLPSPATFRLTAVLGPGSPGAAGPTLGVRIAQLRRAAGSLTGRRKRLAARRSAVIELCDAIATELAAGRPAATALTCAAETLHDLPGLNAVVDAARNGDDVPAALIRASDVRGNEALRLLAGCWRIGVDRGGMLAAVIDGLADSLRDEQSHRDEIALQLAGPRATARLLAVLPALGLAMAAALGAKPWEFLFGSLPGALCLCLGAALDALGLWWTSHLATSAEHLQ